LTHFSPFSFSGNGILKENEEEFWISCRKGDLEKVKELSKLVSDINWVNDKRKRLTGLHIACERGRRDIVEYLLTLPQIQVNQKDSDGITPFHLGCEHGREEIVKILLEDKRVDVNPLESERWTPLYVACMQKSEEIVKILLKK